MHYSMQPLHRSNIPHLLFVVVFPSTIRKGLPQIGFDFVGIVDAQRQSKEIQVRFVLHHFHPIP